MPVILARDEEQAWLDADPGAATDLLDPYPADALRAYPVGAAVGDPANDSPALLEPVEVAEQTGLDEFAG